MNLIGKLRKERILATVLSKFNKNRREKEKKLERERRGISAMLLPKFLYPNSCPVLCPVCPSVECSKKKKKKAICGNGIAKNGRKKNVVAEIWEEILKKVLRSQYFYNTFTTNHRFRPILAIPLPQFYSLSFLFFYFF